MSRTGCSHRRRRCPPAPIATPQTPFCQPAARFRCSSIEMHPIAIGQLLFLLMLANGTPVIGVPADPAGSHPAGTADSVAAYSGTNHVFVPIAANNAVFNCLTGCVTIYGRDDPTGATAEDSSTPEHHHHESN